MPRLDTWLAPAFTARRAALTGRLGQVITVQPAQRRPDGTVVKNAYGAVQYGLSVAYPAQVSGDVRMVRTAAGNEQVSNTTIIVAADTPLTTDDRLTLPDGTRPPVLSIATKPDAAGNLVREVYT